MEDLNVVNGRLTQMPEKSLDGELLTQLSQGDFAAWETLVQRKASLVYSLAKRITHDANGAEDVCQEVFLRLRKSAASFQQGRNVNKWIAKITVNESLRLSAKNKKRQTRNQSIEGLDEMSTNHFEGSGSEKAEQAELYKELRDAMDLLPQALRIPILLRFTCGMKAMDIAEKLKCNPSTVRNRINAGLEKLRGSLKNTYVASIVTPALISTALLSEPVPAALLKRITNECFTLQASDEASSKLPSTPHASPAWPYAKPLGIAACLILSGALALLISQVTDGTSTTESSPTIASRDRSVRGTIDPTAQQEFVSAKTSEPFHAKWTFANGASKDLSVFRGTWTWQKVKGVGCMVAGKGKEEALVLFPFHFPAKNMVISFDTISTSGKLKFAPLWINQKEIFPRLSWEKALSLIEQPRKQQFKAYFVNDATISTFRGKTLMVQQYAKPFPSNRVAFSMSGWRITGIEIKEILADDPVLKRLNPRVIRKQIMAFGGRGLVHAKPLSWKNIPEKFR